MSSPDHLDIFCFFFYGYADHVDLHSFPTRCSSDLGAHGGYHLAQPAEEIAMDEVVLALEGSVAPMDCFVTLPTERVACSHEGDAGQACSTRLLWMRVQGGVLKALHGTTLAELVEFSERHTAEPLMA